MKPLRQLCATGVLTIVLALSTFAGDMATGAIPPPPNPPPSIMSEMPAGGTLANGTTSAETGSIDPLTELTLSFLRSVLSLF